MKRRALGGGRAITDYFPELQQLRQAGQGQDARAERVADAAVEEKIPDAPQNVYVTDSAQVQDTGCSYEELRALVSWKSGGAGAWVALQVLIADLSFVVSSLPECVHALPHSPINSSASKLEKPCSKSLV